MMVNDIEGKEGGARKISSKRTSSQMTRELSLHCSEQRSSVEGLCEDIRFDVFFAFLDNDSNRATLTHAHKVMMSGVYTKTAWTDWRNGGTGKNVKEGPLKGIPLKGTSREVVRKGNTGGGKSK